MGRADYLELGGWNAVCYQCGRKRKASMLVRNWQGYYVCPEHNEPRQPQDFVRSVPDVQTPPWVQPMPTNSFVSATLTVSVDATITAADLQDNAITVYVLSPVIPVLAPPVIITFDPDIPPNAIIKITTSVPIIVVRPSPSTPLPTFVIFPGGGVTGSLLLSSLAFTDQPSDTASDSTITPPVVITAYDYLGAIATDFTGEVSLAIEVNPGTPHAGVLSGDLSVSAIAGVATFSNLSIDMLGTGYTLIASAYTL